MDVAHAGMCLALSGAAASTREANGSVPPRGRGGDDHGARLIVGSEIRSIGRAADADLRLRDPSVSRRHAQAVAVGGAVELIVCPGASLFTFEGRLAPSVRARPGDRILVGATALVVVVAGEQQVDAPTRTDVRTLMTGLAADARGLPALLALIEALEGARDATTAESAFRDWARVHVSASRVDVQSTPASTAELEELEGRLSITAIADRPITVTFACPEITDSLRRTLLVATRLFAFTLLRIRHLELVEEEKSALRTLSVGSARGFLGESPAAQQIANVVARLATSDVSVLIEGETGVGKTFVARLLHEAGPRAREPLRIINCAAIPENLLESELFGHERGAFTGANTARPGAFEAAGAGTLFLDEVGELSVASQAKLLRVLEDRRFERLGARQSIELRARVICATNRDLDSMAAAGQFRRDLLFRIAVVRVRVPALRERGDDLVLLAQQLLADIAQNAGRRITGLSPSALDVIRRYPWPGNVRELRNAIEHAVALGDGALVKAEDLPAGVVPRAAQPADPELVRLPLDLATLEEKAIEAALRATGGNRVRAAALLGISRQTLYNKRRE